MDYMKLAKTAEKFTLDNSPLILTVVGAVGSITATYLTGKATFEAAKILQDKQFVLNAHNEGRDLTKHEKVAAIWHLYILPASALSLSVTAIVYSNRISMKRAAALAAAYQLSEKGFNDYKDKIVEKLGGPKEQAARDEIAQDRVNANPPPDKMIIVDGTDVLCQDQFSGRYFRSSMEKIKSAENELNFRVINHGYASLGDFYEIIGLPSISMAEEVGWDSGDKLSLLISSTLTPNGVPCISIDFNVKPIRRPYGHARAM